jgi:hypothetical protein
MAATVPVAPGSVLGGVNDLDFGVVVVEVVPAEDAPPHAARARRQAPRSAATVMRRRRRPAGTDR